MYQFAKGDVDFCITLQKINLAQLVNFCSVCSKHK